MTMWASTTYFFVLLPISLAIEGGYYWRDYTGIIPKDAIPAGQDVNGKDVFIGQAYVKNVGILVVEITTDSKISPNSKCVKILCGFQEDFFWLLTNSTDLHLDLLGLHPVIGGYEDDGGILNIGRISFEGSTHVGKVNAFDVENSDFVWVTGGKAASAKSYEVLTYHKQPRYYDHCKGGRGGNEELGTAVLLAILDALGKN